MTFTKEQLIERARENVKSLKFASTQHAFEKAFPAIEIDIRLAEIALASLEAEAVGEVVLGEYDDCGCHPDARVACIAADGQADWENFKDGTRLYTAPPAPVVPDEMTMQKALSAIERLSWQECTRDAYMLGWNACRAAMLQGAEPVSQHPELTVWYGSMPETNGKANWTAILHRKGEGIQDGMTIDRSEYPDRVLYAADRVRYLIGEKADRPCILDYDADAHSGYVKPGNSPVIPEGYALVPVDMAPEQMRAVQIKSELGAYAAANLSGAYSLFREFWDVAVAAAPKQGGQK